MYYKITSPDGKLVWNRWGSAKIAPAKGDAVTLYQDTGSADQRFEMVEMGGKVYFQLQDTDLVINRHSENGRLILWPLNESYHKDILFDTQTISGVMRLWLPAYYAYATAEKLASGSNIRTTTTRLKTGQGWKIVKAQKGTSNTNPGGSTQPSKKTLNIPCTKQLPTYGNTYCFACCVMDIANYYKGGGVTMAMLYSKGCVVRGTGYVNTTYPYFGNTITKDWASESEYCKAITEQINLDKPVVVKISGNAGDHFIVAVSGGKNADEILVNDPMLGRTTLRKSFQRKGQSYRHLRYTYRL